MTHMTYESNIKLASIDHETLGIDTQKSVLLSTGVVVGDMYGNIHDYHEFFWQFEEQISYGYTIAESTVAWWNDTPEKATLYNYYMHACKKQIPTLAQTTYHIYKFLLNSCGDDFYLCAKPPKFDISFLDRMYANHLPSIYERPSFRKDFDFSTVNKLCLNKSPYIPTNPKPHNALADAQFQYEQLVYQLELLNVTL